MNKHTVKNVCMLYERIRDMLEYNICGTRVNYVC